MRKLVLFVTAGILVSSTFSSCKKAYNCECISNKGVKTTTTVVATNRSEAQNNCEEKGLQGHCNIQ
jgi:hypothetical protein